MLTYIAQRERYAAKIAQMRRRLTETLPKVCAYFGRDDFMNILRELDRYDRNVETHHRQFVECQVVRARICEYRAGETIE